MLQQTTVATVQPYFRNFIHQWPSFDALAGADIDAVLHAWQGLGYYARARNLHACARVLHDMGGFPRGAEALRTLPGIGPYTAAAIAAIAFGRPEIPIDGNIKRILTRLFGIHRPLDHALPEIERHAAPFRDAHRPGDFAQALMDLGALICTPRAPKCDQCPLRDLCHAYRYDLQAALPVPKKKQIKPTRHGCTYIIQDQEGQILLEKRPASGLLGGLIGTPTTPWDATPPPDGPLRGAQDLGQVTHIFTHFKLYLNVYQVPDLKTATNIAQTGRLFWYPWREIDTLAIPKLFQKVLAHHHAFARNKA